MKMTGSANPAPIDSAAAVLNEIRTLVGELRPGRVPDVRPDSALVADLGLDSLALVEMRTRIEQICEVTLTDDVLDAATVGAWIEAVQTAARQRSRLPDQTAVRRPVPVPPPRDVPTLERLIAGVGTLTDVATLHARLHPQRVHARIRTYPRGAPTEEELTYGTLASGGQAVARALLARGVAPGDAVAIMLPTGTDYFTTFFGILFAGAVPVPLYPPFRRSGLEEHLRRQARILANARAVALVTFPEVRGLARLLRAWTPSLRLVTTTHELADAGASGGSVRLPCSGPDDLALLQYTSGSTGDPKGVILTHAHLLANIKALGDAAHAEPEDQFVSWLPLYHDMGLIGAWLGSLYHAVPLLVMPTMDFIAHPVRWLETISDHRATLSAAPNFGYELCLRRITPEEMSGLDLRSWRMAFNGAEPVSVSTIRRFSERFAPYGFRPEAMAPVYGLAEAAVGLTLPPPGRGPVIDRVRRDSLTRTGRATPAAADEQRPVEVVGCGYPLPGYRVRAVDPAGHELAEREEGRIEFVGPSATPGYLNAADKTARLRRNGTWLDTGDLGYFARGELFVTGRVKDIIIRAGRNVHPGELEEAIGAIAGVRAGCVAVFPATDPVLGTERLIVLAESRMSGQAALVGLRRAIRSVTVDVLGVPPDEVVVAEPGAVLKTTSGKIRRSACRARYESGAGAIRQPGPGWWQVVRFAWGGALPQLRRWRRTILAIAYAVWAWLVLIVLAPVVWLTVLILPFSSWRWHVTRAGGRVLRFATGTPLLIGGADLLPRHRPCVLVANHASYLDGLVLMLALPRPVFFVAHGSFRNQWFVGRFLRRLGTEFVAGRLDTDLAAMDRIRKRLQQGRSVVFFPEGRRSVAPGLGEFHLGGFRVAADAGMPVAPVGIRGTRSVLGVGRRLPHRSAVSVTFGTQILTSEPGWQGALDLRDQARRAVLDLAGERDAT